MSRKTEAEQEDLAGSAQSSQGRSSPQVTVVSRDQGIRVQI